VKINTANCDTATVTVPVAAALIDAVKQFNAFYKWLSWKYY
jgi:hypothetical protein